MAPMKQPPRIEKYGAYWEPLLTPIALEMQCIRQGGRWLNKRTGKNAGMGLKYHYKTFISMLWPEHVWHRWNELELEMYLTYRIIGEMGPASSGKTHSAAVHTLADFYVWSDQTTVLVSSTEREMLEMRVWGEIKKHHRIAKNQFDFLPGTLLESRQRIITDGRYDTEEGRDFRNGICGVPCKKGGNYQGLGSFAGIKNKRVRMVADEMHLMPRIFIDAIANLNKNPDFKCLGLGNPKDTTDALGILCEPSAEMGGWDGGMDQTPKTKTWPTRFDQGICLQLPGSDCPNMDVPEADPPPFPFLITRQAIAADVKFYGIDSLQYTMMDEGRMPRGQGQRRVITRAMCMKFGALEQALWKSEKITKIGFLDAAYGAVGGDRCIFGQLNFGMDPNGQTILALVDTVLVPVSVNLPELPEDQIANFVKKQCEERGILPDHFGFDSTGRGTLVGAFARLWSSNIGLVEFGGRPTERYVSDNIRVSCRDYYFNFVTELWFSVSLTIQSAQFRGLSEEVMNEGAMREWGIVGANKIQVEPKDKMKLKTGRSPDLFDALACGVEMARRKGFVIAKLSLQNPTQADETWKQDLRDRVNRLNRKYSLTYR